jgi:hypothetical protein
VRRVQERACRGWEMTGKDRKRKASGASQPVVARR